MCRRLSFLCRAQVGLCLGDLQLRVRDTAFRLGQLLLCIRKLLAGFGRVDYRSGSPVCTSSPSATSTCVTLPLNLPAKLLTFLAAVTPLPSM